jgi:acyl-lipid omega-6 desaturase (Delta-12 desaturase)
VNSLLASFLSNISHYADMTFLSLSGNFFVKRDIIYNRSYHQFLPLKHIGGLQAAVLPVTPPLLDGEGKKKQMAEEYGFTQIGDELPDDITLKDVMDTLPKEVATVNTSLLLVFQCHKF